MTDDIRRIAGSARGRAQASAYGGLAWAVATAPDKSTDVAAQTAATLAVIERSLAECGSDKRRLLSATVYLARMQDKAEMDRAWCAWIGEDPAGWPQRACVAVALEGDTLVEIAVVAATG